MVLEKYLRAHIWPTDMRRGGGGDIGNGKNDMKILLYQEEVIPGNRKQGCIEKGFPAIFLFLQGLDVWLMVGRHSATKLHRCLDLPGNIAGK